MENWRTIEEFPNYEVSDLGNVRNKKTHRVLKTATVNSGYYVVALRKDNHTSNKSVHRLVAKAWVSNDNPEHKKVVNHKNYDKTDNRAENLEWLTVQDNTLLGCGPTQLKVLKSMINNAMNKAINEWYEQLLTIKVSKEVFTEQLINNAMKEAINTFKNIDDEY